MPLLGMPSHPLQLSESPAHTPHMSRGRKRGQLPSQAELLPQKPHVSRPTPLPITPSQPVQVSLPPPHLPHKSTTRPDAGTPSHPVQVLPFPPHNPHGSNTRPDPATPSHPLQVELSPSHTPQISATLPEKGTPSHPLQVELSPPHTLQASRTREPWGVSLQSDSTSSAAKSPVFLHEHVMLSSLLLVRMQSRASNKLVTPFTLTHSSE
mmetsp:Transcript_6725/g.16839  ORF Transcript_6725/g.16839 Transcript_6725/m.16839 type:complete len:209 (-) Transcript_6725:1405-2031(-)